MREGVLREALLRTVIDISLDLRSMDFIATSEGGLSVKADVRACP